ncbi:GIY-YIG nuclease family protein [Alkalihalobacillus sp. CinArs1]|uniref:GIY-YIG nuclease family protein n=1 Tax=Alkalihalobacillus sp. CinArs1 TaxID=2995314 RepID=UPI0022DE3B6B|nr:GIY-YIG nuclease family protein [Alkalihalobacillus sp. CinArs1]
MSCKHVVYILRCKDDSFYTGYTTDLAHRISQHESGKGAKYTRGRGPFSLVYHATYDTKRKALQEEYRIKQLTRAQKMSLIEKEVYEHVESTELQGKRNR